MRGKLDEDEGAVKKLFEQGAGWLRRMLGQILRTGKFRKGFFFPRASGHQEGFAPSKRAKKQFQPKPDRFGFTERCQIPAPPKPKG